MEAGWCTPVANIEKQVEGKRNVKVDDSKNIGLNGCAKAKSSLKINKSTYQTTAGLNRWVPNLEVEQVTKHVGTDTQLECVNRACSGRDHGE
ncbi:hypothetical protein LINPERPRIM_LOCUS36033 [Linum perenne]